MEDETVAYALTGQQYFAVFRAQDLKIETIKPAFHRRRKILVSPERCILPSGCERIHRGRIMVLAKAAVYV